MSTKQEMEVSSTVHNSISWINWCRLCAKPGEDNQSIFAKSDTGQTSLLATSIGKYFWVNIKAEDEISTSLCKECRKLIDDLSSFTDRVNKVQTLYCLLQNLKPTADADANKLRLQVGLRDGWEHIIKDQPIAIKPSCSHQEVQTDLVIFFNTSSSSEVREMSLDGIRKNSEKLPMSDEKPVHGKNNIDPIENAVEKTGQSIKNINHKPSMKDVITSKRKSTQHNRNVSESINSNEVIIEVDTEQEVEQNFEYLIQNNDDLIEVDEGQFRYKIIKNKTIASQEDEHEVEDSDLFKELKFKSDENGEYVEKTLEDVPNESSIKYSNVQLEEDDSQSEEMEEDYVVMEEEEDYEEEYGEMTETSTKGEDEPSTKNAFELIMSQKKAGRPHKKSGQRTSSVYRYECDECKRKYKNPNVYRKHMRCAHNVIIESMPDFECPVCKKDCSTESRLKLHMRQHLPEEEKLVIPCPYCDRKFGQVGAMRQHVKGIHQELKPYICDQCGRACKTLAALNEHQLVHTDECPFECNVCKKRFKNKPRLKAHMDTHNESAYQCQDCGLTLNTKRTLLQHRLVHSNVKRFQCEFCDAAFKRSKSLKNHLIIHSGLKPYKCQFCDRTFSNGANCRSHKRRVHPKELAEEEARGKKNDPVPIPKLEDLKAAKTAVAQPRKIKRQNFSRSLPKVINQHNRSGDDTDDTAMDTYEMSDIHYEIKGQMCNEGMVDNQDDDEECEETVIYEIIDEI
ncbi:zinc finger protein 37 [Musca vetustissima]|uniref:zinc finger protein 37 n=1 Tax=Musca vetustissima TaxID=27455 RepID=UPI002AB64909|nr:zinc finger protein 37 [Musca vetustissima]